MEDREQKIRDLAHRLWEDTGRPDGQSDRHWTQARAIIGAQEGETSDLQPAADTELPASMPAQPDISVGGD